MFQTLFVIPALWLTSCQHGGVLIEETPMSFAEIRRVVVSVIGEPRGGSKTTYILDSKFIDRKDKVLENPSDARDRAYVSVAILGDRRPYDLRVQVFMERRSPEGYQAVGQDDAWAEKWADKIRKALHESRDKRNVIDDFKAF